MNIERSQPEKDMRELSLSEQRLGAQCREHQLHHCSAVASVLKDRELRDKSVVIVGSSSEELASVVKGKRPKHVILYTTKPSEFSVPLQSRLDIRTEDYTLASHDSFHDRTCALVAVPSDSELDFIRNQLMDRFQLQDVLLVVPKEKQRLFYDLEQVGTVSNTSFSPPRDSDAVILTRGFAPRQSSTVNPILNNAEKKGFDTRNAQNDTEYIEALLSSVKDKLLHREAGQVYGTNRRVVLCLTDNPRKIVEVRRNLARYGLEVHQVPCVEDHRFIRGLIEINLPNIMVKAVARETTNLYQRHSYQHAAMTDLEQVEHISTLACYTCNKTTGAIERSDYSYVTTGFLDLTQRKQESEAVFGWDDIFVVKKLQKTYQDLVAQGAKVSSRDMVWSLYLKDHIYYRNRINLSDKPIDSSQTICFDVSVSEFIDRSEYLSNPIARTSGIANLFQHVANEGVFFRAPINRREKNYWLPGLNAGIPLTPKKDPIHEATFMAHDLCHMLIPDLIVAGSLTPHESRAYIAYRMMSEAFTLVLADMVFVDSLAQAGFEYDFSKRKIYPLFKATGLSLDSHSDFVENVRTLLWANMRYCLRGDDTAYRELLENGQGDLQTLEQFIEKYTAFFVEDFRWTDHNLKKLNSETERWAQWWEIASPIASAHDLKLATVQDISHGLSEDPDQMCEQIFNRMFEQRIEPAFNADFSVNDKDRQQTKGFARYMIGQLNLCANYSFIPDTQMYLDIITDRLSRAASQPLQLEQIDSIRTLYDEYVDLLADKNLITLDDAATYKEVCPLFEPFYVFYDEEQDFYEDLQSISDRLLSATKN